MLCKYLRHASLARNRISSFPHGQRPAPSVHWGVSILNNFSTAGSTDSKYMLETASPVRIAKALSTHLWPSDDSPESKSRKKLVITSLSLMLAGKAVTIQVPYIFKHLVDSLPLHAVDVAATTDVASAAGVPILALLLGYGMSRAASSGFNEYRNAVFARVAQETIRKVGRSVFDHVHSLDLQFHLSKNTGQVSRILDRSNRSISYVLNALVFHIVPTVIEVGLVASLVGYQFGASHSVVVLTTIGGYTAFTVAITQWRTKFRRDMNRLENEVRIQVSLLFALSK